MCYPTAEITINGERLLQGYKKQGGQILLKETTDANTGRPTWLNVFDQKKAKQQIREQL